MQIEFNDTLVELKPENAAEIDQMGQLWDILVDCAKFNRKLEPVGEFVPKNPDKNKIARFSIVEK